MHLYAKKVSAIASGDYYQIHLDSDGRDGEEVDPYEQPQPYVVVQRQLEFFNGGQCYVESDDDDYIGHFTLTLIEFTPVNLTFDIARSENSRVEVSFVLTAAEFEKARYVVDIIFGLREPDYDESDLNSGL